MLNFRICSNWANFEWLFFFLVIKTVKLNILKFSFGSLTNRILDVGGTPLNGYSKALVNITTKVNATFSRYIIAIHFHVNDHLIIMQNVFFDLLGNVSKCQLIVAWNFLGCNAKITSIIWCRILKHISLGFVWKWWFFLPWNCVF